MGPNISLNNFSVRFNLTVDNGNTTNRVKEYENLKVWYQMFLIDLYGTLATGSIGILTNILVVATLIVTWKFWRHSLGTLLLTLACVDIIGNGVCLGYYLLIIFSPYFVLPGTFYYLNNGFKRLSFLMMIPISANRYALICKPFSHRRITSQKSTFAQIATLTVFSFSAGIFELYRWQMTQFTYQICVLVINLIMSVVIPLIITFVLTILVIREFRRMNTTLEGPASRLGEKNVTRAMMAVNVAFIVLNLPPTVFGVVFYFSKLESNSDYSLAFIGLIILNDINFSINIFIYTLCLPIFRSTLLGFFTCKCCIKRGDEAYAMPVL